MQKKKGTKERETNTTGSPYYVRVVGKYAYGSGSGGLYIWDISNPANIVVVGSITGTGAPHYLSGATGLHVVGRYVYIASETGDAMQIIDVLDPTSPTMIGIYRNGATLDGAIDVYVSGRYAYVVCDGSVDGLVILDVSDPTNPTHTGNIKTLSL